MAKVVIIGAGSLNFSQTLITDILSYSNLAGSHIALVDIDSTRLEYASKITERIIREGNYKNASSSATADRREALVGADYVITSILVGGYKAIEMEIDISKKYGVDQCIGDTLNPGGIMRCLRTLPHQVAVARDMRELCPKAFLLNYTNPMSMLMWGMYKAVPEIKMVGLCHSVQGTSGEWAERLGYAIKDISFDCFGINHQAWFTRFETRKNGKILDLLPAIREKAQEVEVWLGDTSRMEYVKHFGFPVTESSGHNSEYSPWFRKTEKIRQAYCPGNVGWNGRSGFIKELYARPHWKQEMEAMASGKEALKLERSHEYGAQIIHAMEGGEPVIIHGNVENKGYIPNLPNGACVEVPCQIDSLGMRPIHCGEIPSGLAAINQTQINVQRLAVEAALEKDPEKVFQAMAMDPLTAAVLSLDAIRSLTRELMEAHVEYIPDFKGRIPADKPILINSKSEKVERHLDPVH